MASYLDSMRSLMGGKLSAADKKALDDLKKKQAAEALKKKADPKALENSVKNAVNPMSLFRRKK
jgi:hypothetical protein